MKTKQEEQNDPKIHKTLSAIPENRPVAIMMGLHEAHYILQAFYSCRLRGGGHSAASPLNYEASDLIQTLQKAMKEDHPDAVDGLCFVEPEQTSPLPNPVPAHTTIVHNHYHYEAPRPRGPQG